MYSAYEGEGFINQGSGLGFRVRDDDGSNHGEMAVFFWRK